MLDARAGTPPSPISLISLFQRHSGLDRLDELFPEWERWLVDIGETHTTLAMLSFFRSPNPRHSWVTAAMAIIDTANIRVSAVSHPGGGNADAWLVVQAGTDVLRRISGFFQVPLELVEGDAIGVTRAEFDAALAELAARGVPLDPDREAVWERFSTRRAAYDPAGRGLASLVDAPSGFWSGDASTGPQVPPIFRRNAVS